MLWFNNKARMYLLEAQFSLNVFIKYLTKFSLHFYFLIAKLGRCCVWWKIIKDILASHSYKQWKSNFGYIGLGIQFDDEKPEAWWCLPDAIDKPKLNCKDEFCNKMFRLSNSGGHLHITVPKSNLHSFWLLLIIAQELGKHTTRRLFSTLLCLLFC